MKRGMLLLLSLVLAPGLMFPPVSAIEIQHWNTENGVPVYFIESHDLPIVDMRLSFRAASSRDGDLPGLAGLVNGLLVEGTGDLSAQQIALEFEQVGAQLGHSASRDMAWTSLRSLSDRAKLDPVVDLLARVTALPNFSQSALNRDRDALLVNLASRQKQIASIASDRFNQALYRNHPYEYGSGGVAEAIEVITLEDLSRFHHRYYVAKNASLAIVGDLSLEAAKSYANQISDYLVAGKAAEDLPKPAETHAQTLRIDFETAQSQVKVGMPVLSRFDPDYYALIVGNHILGGNGSNSRLMQKIREEHGLSYSVYSYFAPLETNGPFEMGLQTRNAQVDEALGLLEQTLQAFIDHGPEPGELELAKRNILGGFALRFDSNLKLLNQLSVIGFYRLPLDYLDNYPRRIETVRAEDVHSAFRRRIKPEQMIRVIVGPQEKSKQ